MDFYTILIILGIILAFVTYFGIQESQRVKSDNRNKDIDNLTGDYVLSSKKTFLTLKKEKEIEKKKEKEKGKREDQQEDQQEDQKQLVDEEEVVPEYFVQTKTKNELSQREYQILENQYNQLLYKRGAEPFNQSLKENSRIFIAYDKNGIPVGQAAILILDTHDFWGAFSKIRNLNLDAQSVILYNVCVVPEHRRRGIAEKILRDINQWCFTNNKPNIVLFVDPNNQSAIRLYERMGYSIDKSHYAPNGAEIMMRLKLR